MKILVVHNAYLYRGGEDAVVDAEITLLRSHGHEVELYLRDNQELKDIPALKVCANTFWSQRSANQIEGICRDFQPDLIHAHNIFPLISPAFYWGATRRRIPVIQTLHNFRILCPQAMLLRDGNICEDCIGRLPWRAVTRRCYHESAGQTAVLSGMLSMHSLAGTWRDKVTRYIVFNQFCRDKFVRGGLPAERIRIKPNFVTATPPAFDAPRQGGLYVGRLAPEKGLQILARALDLLPPLARMRIAGIGPMQDWAADRFGQGYLGALSPSDVRRHMNQAQYLVAPSVSYETFGLAALEAFACGTPVIASRQGGLGELIRDGSTGLLFEPGDAAGLAARIAWAEEHPEAMRRMGEAARAEYEKRYTPEINYRMLIDIYQEAIAARQGLSHVR